MSGGVVVLQELALGAQRAIEIRGHGSGPEGGLIPLVLELDQNDVIYLPRGKGRPHDRAGVRLGRCGQRRPEKQGSDREGHHRAGTEGTE